MVRVDRRKQTATDGATPAGKGKGGPGAVPAGKGKGGPTSRGGFNPFCIKINQRLAAAGPTNPGEISAIVTEHIGIFNSVNVATALHQLAKSVNRSADNPVAQQHDSSVHEQLGARAALVLAQEGQSVTPRSLTSIVWAMGKLRILDGELLNVVIDLVTTMMNGGLLDAFGLANVAWTLATLHQHSAGSSVETVTLSERQATLLDMLASKSCGCPETFKPQELCNLLWAFATLKRRHVRLFERFAEPAVKLLAEFTPQGLSQTVWAYSKLNLSKHSFLIAAAGAAIPKLPGYDAQSVATLAWSFANLEVEHRSLFAAVCLEAKKRPAVFNTASCSQLLWALSRVSDGVDEAAVGALCAQLKAISSVGGKGVSLRPQELLYALGALAKLPMHLEPELPDILCIAAANAAPSLTANKLGIAAWALSRPLVHARLSSTSRQLWCDALKQRTMDAIAHVGWRSIGYVEIALRQLGGLGENDPFAAALTEAARVAIEATNERSVRRNATPVQLLQKHSAAWGEVPRGSHVLLAGFDPCPELEASLREHGLTPIHWRRFASGAEDTAAATWPSEVTAKQGGLVAACFVRWPWYAAGDAAAMSLRAVASVAQRNAPLWLCGNVDEGADNASEVLNEAYGAATTVEVREGAALYHARHTAPSVGADGLPSPRLGLEGWRSEVAAVMPTVGKAHAPRKPASLNWSTYPGLFAGGGVDVMTTALLNALPTPPTKGRILDACCGSGTIAAALLEAHRAQAPEDGTGASGKKLKVHCLDADAVALAAAKDNVTAAKKFFLTDSWPCGKAVKYDWIVSNPPVHRGQPDDFSVVLGLIRGARSRLRKGGVLWMVCQVQVPIGRMLAHNGTFAWIDASVSADGRFVVWSAGRGGKEEADIQNGTERPVEEKKQKEKQKKREKAAKEARGEDNAPTPTNGNREREMATASDGRAAEGVDDTVVAGIRKKADSDSKEATPRAGKKRKERDATGKRKRRRLAAAERKRSEEDHA